MVIATTFLEQSKQKPESIVALLVDFLALAKTSLHLAIYDFRLSDEQAAEVRRRLAEKNPKTVTLAEFNEHLRRRYGV